MAGADRPDGTQPLIEPRMIRFLKQRPRLIDKGFRQEFLEEFERQARERRDPGRLAEKTVDKVFARVRESTDEPVKRRARDAVSKVNEGPLSRL